MIQPQEIKVGVFKNRKTKELALMVSQIGNTHKVFNASTFELVSEHEVEALSDVFQRIAADLQNLPQFRCQESWCASRKGGNNYGFQSDKFCTNCEQLRQLFPLPLEDEE